MYSVFFGKPKAAVATPEESAAIATESLKKDDENMDAKMPEGDVLETNDVELKEEQINEHPIQKNENTEEAAKVPEHVIDKTEIEVNKDVQNNEFEDQKNDVETKGKEDKEEEEMGEDDKLKVPSSPVVPNAKSNEKKEEADDEDEGDEEAVRQQVDDVGDGGGIDQEALKVSEPW